MNRFTPPPLPTESSFTSPLRSERVTARLGLWVGIAFGICLVTGLVSHQGYATHGLLLPTRPVWGYRVTQGVHVLSGTAAIPLLLMKLWSVYPKLFAPVPFGRLKPLVLHLLERGSVLVLVSSAVFQLSSGLLNSAQWYPWAFSFRRTHYAVAWIAIGALLVHIAVKLPVIRRGLTAPVEEPMPTSYSGPSRRTLLRTGYLAATVAVLASAGSAVPALRRVSVFGVRSGHGPQHLPINRSARAAGVIATALHPDFRLTVAHGARLVQLSRADLQAMTQRTVRLPIACVEGWSAGAIWTGVPVRALLDLVGAPLGADVRVVSLQTRHAFGATTMTASFAEDPLTLLALRLNGDELSLDHGYPCRVIAPNRPGVMQTKWVRRLEVIT